VTTLEAILRLFRDSTSIAGRCPGFTYSNRKRGNTGFFGYSLKQFINDLRVSCKSGSFLGMRKSRAPWANFWELSGAPLKCILIQIAVAFIPATENTRKSSPSRKQWLLGRHCFWVVFPEGFAAVCQTKKELTP